MTSHRAIAALHLCVFLVLTPCSASAQAVTGTIGGVVRDSTGSVLPGVSVEAASAALIEKLRSVVTDAQGVYKIVDLRPGVYTVTFTLSGFSTVKQGGIELTAGITATANADLRPGTIEETIVVTGASPIVDVENTTQHRSLSRQVMDDLPTGRSYSALGVLLPGVVVSVQEFGGSTGERLATLSIHGSAANDMPLLFDGMRDHTVFGNGGGNGTNWVINNGMVEETSIDTSGMTAEAETSGVRVNSIPKSGGNRFSSVLFTNYASGKWQANNFDAGLAATGAATPDRTDHIWDVNPGVGGPIKVDKVWFYASYRNWGAETIPTGAFPNLNVDGYTFVPDVSQPVHNPLWQFSWDGRVTWQIFEKHKVAVYGANEERCWCANFASATTSYEASTQFRTPSSYFAMATWNWVKSDRMLIEAGIANRGEHWAYYPQPDVPQNRSSILDQATGIRFAATTQTIYQEQISKPWNGRAALNYVTGSHNLKVGAQWFSGSRWFRQNGSNNSSYTFSGVTATTPSSVPISVTYHNTPVETNETLNMNLGLFAQEQWRIRRMTANLGIRFDYLNAQVDGGSLPVRQYAGAVAYERIANVPNWKDVSPRVGLSYDLFGTGKTALKWNLGRFVEGQAIGIASAVDPAIAATYSSTTRNWADANRDFLPDCDNSIPSANGECGPSSNLAFNSSTPALSYAPGVVEGWGTRGFNWETMAAIQHQFLPGLSFEAGYFRRWFGNFRMTNNTSVTPQDYSTYCIIAPADQRLPDGGGYQICGLADVSEAKFGVTNNVISQVDEFGKQTQVFDGYDVSVTGRLPRGITFVGGTSTGRTKTNNCFVVDSPQQLVFCDVEPPFQTRIRFLGTYPLPWWGVRVSATYQNNPGPNITASYAAPAALITPSLGRPLSGGARSATVPLVAAGVLYGERMHQVDLRVGKNIQVQRLRVQPQIDFYNMLNANYVLTMNNTYGSAWQRPTSIMQGRIMKLGVQVDF